jgi:hypothetical protein
MQNTKIENLECWYEGVFYNEEWKEIPSLGGNYLISNFGRVKSLSRVSIYARRKEITPNRLLKIRKTPDGYLMISISHSAKVFTFLVHRLVASVFIPNPENKRTVNHKFGNKTDNRFWMLEWHTHKENINHCFETGLKTNKSGAKASRSIPISQFTLEGVWIRDLWGAKQFEIETGLTGSLICAHLKGKHEKAHGFKWKYKDSNA